MPRKCRTGSHAFSLVELLVVMAIVALLISMLLPSLQRAKYRTEEIKCVSNVRQAAMAGMKYMMDHEDQFFNLDEWGYGRFDWYPKLRSYLTLTTPQQDVSDQKYQYEAPLELMCPSWVEGSGTYGLPYFSYSINWRLRFHVQSDEDWGAPYRLGELRDPDGTGLFFDSGRFGSAIYYMDMREAFLGGGTASGPYARATPQHHGQGVTLSFFDGHALFNRGDAQTVAAHAETPDYIWTHRKFWGWLGGNKYVSAYYIYQP